MGVFPSCVYVHHMVDMAHAFNPNIWVAEELSFKASLVSEPLSPKQKLKTGQSRSAVAWCCV